MIQATQDGGERPRRPAISATLLAVLAGALAFPAAVWAHGGAARLAADPDTVRPGGVVTMRGEDLGSDAAVVLVLIGSTGRVSLGTVTADDEGHLATSVQIPLEMPQGIYRLEGSADGTPPIAVSLIVDGAPLPVGQEEEPGGRDEDDGLLIALPSGWQQALAQPPITAVPVTTSSIGQVARGPEPLTAVGIVAVALIGALAIGTFARRRRRLA